MSLVGADIDQMRSLARTFSQAAQQLEGSAAAVSGTLSALHWSGPDGERFRSQWHGESQPRVRRIAAALRDASNVVLRNADEQEQASTPGTGSSALGTVSHSAQPGDVLRGAFGEKINPLVEINNFLDSNAVWPITWGTMLGAYDRVGVLPLLDALGLASDSTLTPEEKISEAGHSLIDLGVGLLKDRGAVGYLSGVAIAQWTDVFTAFSEADFNPATVQNVTDYIASDPGGAFNAAKEAVINYFPQLFSNVVPW